MLQSQNHREFSCDNGRRAAPVCFTLLSLASIALGVVGVGCNPGGTKQTGPTPATSTASTSVTTAPSTPVAGAAPVVIVKGQRPLVREASVDVRSGAETLGSMRLLLSKITPADGVRIALRFSKLSVGADAKAPPEYMWHRTLAGLKITISGPGSEKKTLQLAAEGKPNNMQVNFVHELVIDAENLVEWSAKNAWKQPSPGLLANPGSYKIQIEGDLITSAGATPFKSEPIPFEVVAMSESWKSVDGLLAEATPVAQAQQKTGTVNSMRVGPEAIDDVADNRWLRYRLEMSGGRNDDVYVDVLVSPAGKVIAAQTFSHWSCVAEGTSIATPSGDRSIESLRVGDHVWGFDVEKSARVDTVVEHVHRSHRSDLIQVGGAMLTPEHPVYSFGAGPLSTEGRWVHAGELTRGSSVISRAGAPLVLGEISSLERPAEVFDLTVGWPHTFFAGEILVHNKAAYVPLAKGDPWEGKFLRTTDASPLPSSVAIHLRVNGTWTRRRSGKCPRSSTLRRRRSVQGRGTEGQLRCRMRRCQQRR